MATQRAVRWNIRVSKRTDRDVRRLLGPRKVRTGEMSKFVENAVRLQLFHGLVDKIHDKNRHIDVALLEADIDEALAEVRAERRAKLK